MNRSIEAGTGASGVQWQIDHGKHQGHVCESSTPSSSQSVQSAWQSAHQLAIREQQAERRSESRQGVGVVVVVHSSSLPPSRDSFTAKPLVVLLRDRRRSVQRDRRQSRMPSGAEAATPCRTAPSQVGVSMRWVSESALSCPRARSGSIGQANLVELSSNEIRSPVPLEVEQVAC